MKERLHGKSPLLSIQHVKFTQALGVDVHRLLRLLCWDYRRFVGFALTIYLFCSVRLNESSRQETNHKRK